MRLTYLLFAPSSVFWQVAKGGFTESREPNIIVDSPRTYRLTRNSHGHPLLRASVLLSKVPQTQQLDARASEMKGLELAQIGQLRGKGNKGQ